MPKPFTRTPEEDVKPDEMKSLMKRFYSLWEGASKLAPEEICSDRYLDHMPHPGPEGLPGLKAMLQMIRTAFPDATCTAQMLLVDGDKVIGQSRFRGTHSGPLMNIPPTHKTVEMATIDICRVEDGKIAEIWHLEDMLGLMIQLGVVPPPG